MSRRIHPWWCCGCPAAEIARAALDEQEQDGGDKIKRLRDALSRIERRELQAAAEADRLRSALGKLLDAVDKYTYASLGDAEDSAREMLSEEHCPDYTQFAKNYERMESALWDIGEATLTPGNWVPTEQAALNGMVSAANERSDLLRHANERRDMVEFDPGPSGTWLEETVPVRVTDLRDQGCRFFYLRPGPE